MKDKKIKPIKGWAVYWRGHVLWGTIQPTKKDCLERFMSCYVGKSRKLGEYETLRRIRIAVEEDGNEQQVSRRISYRMD